MCLVLAMHLFIHCLFVISILSSLINSFLFVDQYQSFHLFISLSLSICLCTKTYPSTHLSIITIFVSIYLLIYFLVTFVLILLTGYGDNLMPGEFRFPFSFKLPDKLPPTYEGLYGHIRYLVEARNDVQWGATEHAIAQFNVAAVQDLNADPKLAVSGCRVI